MRSRPPAYLFGLVLTTCFILGVVSVFIRKAGTATPAPRTPAQRPTVTRAASPTPGQTAVLFLGIDDLQEPAPVLLAVWVATYSLPGRDVFLFGFPTDTLAGEDTQTPLQDLFAWDPSSGPDPAFLTALQAITLLPPRLIVVLDALGFAAAIDYLGGVDLNGVQLSGAEVNAVLDLWQDNPGARVEAQARVLEALSQRSPSLGATPDLTPLLALIPEHGYLSTQPADAALLLAPLLPLDPTAVHILTLTPPPSSSLRDSPAPAEAALDLTALPSDRWTSGKPML